MPQTVMDKVKLMAGMEPDNPPELLDELNDCFQLSRMVRLYGFAICVSAGLFCSFLSSLMWTRPTKFAILYTHGQHLVPRKHGFSHGFRRAGEEHVQRDAARRHLRVPRSHGAFAPSLLFPEFLPLDAAKT